MTENGACITEQKGRREKKRDAKGEELQIHREGLEQMLGELVNNVSPVGVLVAAQEVLAPPQVRELQEIFQSQFQRRLADYLVSSKEVPDSDGFMKGVKDVVRSVAHEVSLVYPVRVHIEPIYGQPREATK